MGADVVTSTGDITGASVPALLARLDRAQAARLARSGDLDAAALVLTTGAAAEDPAPADLDLLARIRAQQGRLLEAERLWTRAAGLAPEAFTTQLDRLARVAVRRPGDARRSRRPAVLWLGVAAAVAVAFALGAAVVPRGTDAALADLRQAQDEMGTTLRGLVTAGVEERPDDTAALATLTERLTAAGLEVRPEGDGVEVIFPMGLFARGTETAPGAVDLLETAASALEPGRWDVTVVGHGDDLPVTSGRFRDATDLETARAVVAATVLAGATGIPLPEWDLGLGEGRPPYPNTADGGRERNRTVTLKVSPAAP